MSDQTDKTSKWAMDAAEEWLSDVASSHSEDVESLAALLRDFDTAGYARGLEAAATVVSDMPKLRQTSPDHVAANGPAACAAAIRALMDKEPSR